MAKFKVSTKGNLISITQKQFGKLNVNERELKVFEENLLPGFFRPKLEAKNKLTYTAPKSITLEAYIKKDMTVHKMYSVLAQFGEMIKGVEQYGFYLHNIILESRLVYVKEITGELFFLYTPLISTGIGVNLFGFLADTFKNLKTEDAQLQVEHQKVMAFLESPNHFSLNELEMFVQQNYPQIYQQITRRESGQSGFISSTRLGYEQHYHPSMALQNPSVALQNPSVALQNPSVALQPYPSDEMGTTLLVEEEGTTLLCEEEEGTTLLCEEPTVTAFLVRRKTNESITVNRDVFKIGKDFSCDYVVTDNNAVSRRHATLYRNLSMFYIGDDGSKNHTYVNGMILMDNQVELHNGDIVKLANEEFEFFIN